MNSPTRARVRCAVYTRKSSEEGLEQEFNSLDAQREACEAYITSQKHEPDIVVTILNGRQPVRPGSSTTSPRSKPR